MKGAGMIHVKQTLISSNGQLIPIGLKSVREFLDAHGDALANAAYALGGGSASGSVYRLIEAVRSSKKLTRSQVMRLRHLHALLMLENVGDPDRLETALFANMVPGSSEMAKICLLADALGNLLQKLKSCGERELDVGKAALSDAA
jgi:hypothetical protein